MFESRKRHHPANPGATTASRFVSDFDLDFQRLAELVRQTGEKFIPLQSQRIENREQLDHVKAALAPFDLRDKRLRLPEPFSEFDLRDAALLARGRDLAQQGCICLRMC